MTATGIILAGGKNLRLGRNKALEIIGGKPIIERVVDRLLPLIDQIVIVTAKGPHELPTNLEAEFAEDIYVNGGPLGGIYTGLKASQNETNILVACDMPFLNTELLRHLVFLSPSNDAVVPRSGPELFEPLHAVYSKKCLPVIKKHLDSNDRAISSFLKDVKVLYVEEAECREFDPELPTFFNINRQADLEVARKMAEKES
ncbi:MAG: molybdenum cofactor guanylyltransferase [Dehalococcoidales bacterium]|nr:molybdenum cofactor guanylyltransferase [Dehalococcoidales bacterium]